MKSDPKKISIDAIREHYEHRLAPKRSGHDICDWASRASQLLRFQVLTDNVELTGKKLLDVGCGVGDLYAFLRTDGVQVDYVGVDILEKMVEEALSRHPGADFHCEDIFAKEAGGPFERESFDVVFCSGMFNLNLGNNREFMPFALRRMLDLTHDLMVFNLLHARAQGSDDRYAHSSPHVVQEILTPLNVEMRLLEDYLPNDFTFICRKRRDSSGEK